MKINKKTIIHANKSSLIEFEVQVVCELAFTDKDRQLILGMDLDVQKHLTKRGTKHVAASTTVDASDTWESYNDAIQIFAGKVKNTAVKLGLNPESSLKYENKEFGTIYIKMPPEFKYLSQKEFDALVRRLPKVQKLFGGYIPDFISFRIGDHKESVDRMAYELDAYNRTLDKLYVRNRKEYDRLYEAYGDYPKIRTTGIIVGKSAPMPPDKTIDQISDLM